MIVRIIEAGFNIIALVKLLQPRRLFAMVPQGAYFVKQSPGLRGEYFGKVCSRNDNHEIWLWLEAALCIF